MFRKFTFLLSLVLINVMILGFTPQQEVGGIEVVWWFWLCLVSILIVFLFLWFMLVAGRREVEPIEPPEPPMAGRKKTADIDASTPPAARPVDTTEQTMSETTYKVTDPDGKYVKGSLFGDGAKASADTSASAIETAAAVETTETVVEETVVEAVAETETVAAKVETTATVTETVVEETVVEVVETPPAKAAVAASPIAKPKKDVAAKAAPAKKKKRGKYSEGRDDLKKVEGIGPKIEGLFNADGIMTFEQLANAKIERLQGILNDAGSRYRAHKPGTWPEQAALAAKGDWDALNKLQDELDGGVRK